MKIDKIQPTGRVSITITDTRTGKTEVREGNNLVVALGREACASLLATGNPDKVVQTMEFGTSDAATDMSDSAITGAFAKALDSSVASGNTATFIGACETSENNGMDIEEVGLICDDGTLFARYTTGTIAKSSFLRVAVTWTITF